MTAPKKKRKRKLHNIRVIERKLGRERNWAQHISGLGIIEIDPRQSSKKFLNSLIHELMHELRPELTDRQVRRVAAVLTDIIWKKNYRRIQP